MTVTNYHQHCFNFAAGVVADSRQNLHDDDDVMFDGFFDEAIFEAQLSRISIFGVYRVRERLIVPLQKQTNTYLQASSLGSGSGDKSINRRRHGPDKNQQPARTARHPQTVHTKTRRLDFGATQIGCPSSLPLEICNGCRHDVSVAIEFEGSFDSRHRQFTIKRRSKVRVPVRFVPTAPGKHVGFGVTTALWMRHGEQSHAAALSLAFGSHSTGKSYWRSRWYADGVAGNGASDVETRVETKLVGVGIE